MFNIFCLIFIGINYAAGAASSSCALEKTTEGIILVDQMPVYDYPQIMHDFFIPLGELYCADTPKGPIYELQLNHQLVMTRDLYTQFFDSIDGFYESYEIEGVDAAFEKFPQYLAARKKIEKDIEMRIDGQAVRYSKGALRQSIIDLFATRYHVSNSFLWSVNGIDFYTHPFGVSGEMHWGGMMIWKDNEHYAYEILLSNQLLFSKTDATLLKNAHFHLPPKGSFEPVGLFHVKKKYLLGILSTPEMNSVRTEYAYYGSLGKLKSVKIPEANHTNTLKLMLPNQDTLEVTPNVGITIHEKQSDFSLFFGIDPNKISPTPIDIDTFDVASLGIPGLYYVKRPSLDSFFKGNP